MARRKKRWLGICLAAALLAGTAVPAQAETIEDAQKQVDELQKQKDAAEAQKDSFEARLKTIASDMEDTQKKLETKQAEIDQAEAELVQAKVDENTQYQSMKMRIKFMYEKGNIEFLEVLADSEDIGDFLNKTEYISQISEYDREKLEEFQKTVKKVQEQEEALQNEYAELNKLQNKLVDDQNQVQALLKENEVKLSDLGSQLNSKMQTLQALVEEEQRRQAEAEAAKEAAEQGPSGGGYVPPSGGNVVSGNGYFTHPCPGYSYQSSYFGEIREFEVGGHKGHDYAAPTGTPTYAAAAGRVIIANYSSSAGNWVVIDHGNGLTTKYMHHSAICVSAGQYVEKGQQIGYVGSTGQSTGPHLHFQVEENYVPVNPDKYL